MQEQAGQTKTTEAGMLGWTRRHQQFLVMASLILLVVVTYSNSLHGVFVFDDKHNIVENPAIRLDSLTFEGLYRASVENPAGQPYARPIAYASFALNYYFGQSNVVGYHVVNIAIHCLTGIGFYLLLLMLLATPRIVRHVAEDRKTIAAFSTFLWLVHPTHVQAVTYIVQRMAAMAAMFAVWSLVAFLWASSQRGRRRVTGFGIFAILLLFAIGSKSTAIIVPVLLALGPLLFDERAFSGKRLAAYAGVAVTTTFAALLLIQGWSGTMAMLSTAVLNDPGQLLTIPRSFFYSLSLVALPLPSRLNLDHHIPFSSGLFDPVTTAIALFGLVVIISLPILLARKRPLIAAALIWFLVLFLLEAAAVKQDPVFEHRLYLPSLGLFLIAGLFFEWLARARNMAAATIPVIAIVLAFAAASHRRNEVWLSEVALWRDAVLKSPKKARGYAGVTGALMADGQAEEALRYYGLMAQIIPENYEDHAWFGQAASNVGDAEAVLVHVQRSLELRQECMAQRLLTVTLASLGRVGEANAALHVYQSGCKQAMYFERTVATVHSFLNSKHLALESRIARNPDDLEAHFMLAGILIREKNPEKALVHLEIVNRQNPRHVQVLENIGFCHYDLGRYEEAMKAHRSALAINPKTSAAYYGLGQALMQLGENEEAIASFRRFTEITKPRDPFIDAALANIAELEKR